MMLSSLISLAKRDIQETIPGLKDASYFLPASKNGIPSILHVDDSYYYKPDIEGNQDMIKVSSENIVESVVHMHITSQLAYKVGQHPALFCVPNKMVTIENLKEYEPQARQALEAQKQWFIALVHIADDDWQIARRHNMISDIQRTAAREMNLKRDWLITIEDESTKKDACPFCGTGLLNPNAPICPTCGKIHNPARMAELESKYKINEGRPAATVK